MPFKLLRVRTGLILGMTLMLLPGCLTSFYTANIPSHGIDEFAKWPPVGGRLNGYRWASPDGLEIVSFTGLLESPERRVVFLVPEPFKYEDLPKVVARWRLAPRIPAIEVGPDEYPVPSDAEPVTLGLLTESYTPDYRLAHNRYASDLVPLGQGGGNTIHLAGTHWDGMPLPIDFDLEWQERSKLWVATSYTAIPVTLAVDTACLPIVFPWILAFPGEFFSWNRTIKPAFDGTGWKVNWEDRMRAPTTSDNAVAAPARPDSQ